MTVDEPPLSDRQARAVIIPAAAELGFTRPAAGLPLELPLGEFEQAEAAVAFLWEHHPARLEALVGERARLAPLPADARCPWRERWCHYRRSTA